MSDDTMVNNAGAENVGADDKQNRPAKKEIDREYLKKQMRERAATEAPHPDKKPIDHAEEKADTQPVHEALQETKEAVKEVAEKLEQLTEQVAESAPKGKPKKSSKGR
jgi:hypothetical protein